MAAAIEHDGRIQTIKAWAKEVGIHPATLQNRLKHGWTIEEALTRPVDTRKGHPNRTKSASRVPDEVPAATNQPVAFPTTNPSVEEDIPDVVIVLSVDPDYWRELETTLSTMRTVHFLARMPANATIENGELVVRSLFGR